MCEFRPGDEVICIDDVPAPKRAEVLRRRGYSIPWDLCAGRIYRVSSVMNEEDALVAFRKRYPDFPVRAGSGLVYLSLENNESVAFSARRFRKVQRRDLDAWLSQATTYDEEQHNPAPAKRKKEKAQ